MLTQNNRGRLSLWVMSYFLTHVPTQKYHITHRAAKQCRKIPPRAFCTEKFTKCPTQYLPPLFCLGLTHAPVRVWDLLNLTKEKTAYAIFSFVAHPPPNNEKLFVNNRGTSNKLENYCENLKMRQIVEQTGA